MTAFNPTQKLTILKHLAGGKNVDLVATIMHCKPSDIIEAAKGHGYPDVEKLKWAADILEKKLEDDDQPTASTLPASAPRAASLPNLPAHGTLPPVSRPDEIRILINTAKAHPAKRIQAAGDRLIDQVNKLRALIVEDDEKHAARRQAETEKAAARAEVERLEKQLAAAKARLRPAKKTATKLDTKKAYEPSIGGPTAADIRAWARENDVQCPATGRVPGDVRDAYDDAHQQVA